MLKSLDSRDTLLLKGLGMTEIVFHNFFHVVSPVHENEFTFDPERFRALMAALNDVRLAIPGILSFFGHYGVHIFGFLSAYGLARSHWDDPAPWAQFIWGRIKKLYPIVGLVVIPMFIAMAVQSGPIVTARTAGVKMLWMSLGISNLIPGYDLPPVGPWWFIPFIIQFYALFPLLRWLTKRFGGPGLAAISLFSMALFFAGSPRLESWSLCLTTTPIAHMPEFCLGIYAARYTVRITALHAIASACVLILGSVYSAFWPFTMLASLILFLFTYLETRTLLRKATAIEMIGKYSFLIFMINGVVRLEFLPLANSPSLQIAFGCASALVSFFLAFVLQEFLMPGMIARKISTIAAVTDEPGDSIRAFDFRRVPSEAN